MKTIISLAIALLSVIGLNAQCITEFNYTFNQSTGTFEGVFYPDGNMIPNPSIPVTYTWDFNGNTLTGDVVTYDFGQNQCLIVSLTATGGGCTASISDSVFNPNVFVDTCTMFITYNITPADDNQTPNGAIDLTVQAGTAPFSFSWSNQATSEDISGLYSGTYTVQIIDDIGCELVQSFDVPINDSLNPVNTLSVSISHFFNNVDCTATVSADVYGGTPPYSYQWNNLQTTQSLYGGCSGDLYCVTVTDATSQVANACATLYYVQDTSVTITGTLQSSIDTCLNTISGQIANFTINDNTITITWEFADTNQNTSYMIISYPVQELITQGVYEIFLYLYCDDMGKSVTSYSDQIYVSQGDITGLTPINLQTDFTLYPNPVNDLLNIEISALNTDNVELIILNSTGQIVFSSKENICSGQNAFNYDVSSLSKGMYLINILGDEIYKVKKFIK
ncbi:MAG: T9SS type A sorting domain-containing protein [Bacteroidales bacterium]|nr:T9SS type A sorting domain-containing protein [Bacteroidales bacterium]